jgi:hypothetical protein
VRNKQHRRCRSFVRGITLYSALLACGQDVTQPRLVGADQLYWQLVLNHHAITLALEAPYNKVQLAATPVNVHGVPIQEESTVRYAIVGNDPSIEISSDGIVTAKAVKTGVRVVASGTVGEVTFTDSVWINVTDIPVVPIPPVLDHIDLRVGNTSLTNVDCSMTSGVVSGETALIAQAMNDQQPIPGTIVKVSSSDESLIRVDPYTGKLAVSCIKTGPVWLKGVATVYGQTREDSIQVKVVWPRFAQVGTSILFPTGETDPFFNFVPGTLVVGAGATVAFVNSSFTDSLDIVFDNPAAVVEAPPFLLSGNLVPSSGSGNITPWMRYSNAACNDLPAGLPRINCLLGIGTSSMRARQFPTPGTYQYRSKTQKSSTGVIIVKGEME